MADNANASARFYREAAPGHVEFGDVRLRSHFIEYVKLIFFVVRYNDLLSSR